MRHLPALAVVLPLLASVFIAALRSHLPRRVSDVVSIVTCVAAVAVDLLLLRAASGALVVTWFGGWMPRGPLALGICFAIDPIGAGLALLAAALTLLAFVYASVYFQEDENLFHVLMLVFLAGMQGFCLTGDLFNLFVFFELMGIAAFALVGHASEEQGPIQGSFQFAVTNAVGAYLLLDGVALLYGRTGALNLAQIGDALATRPPDALVLVAFALIACGLLVKGAVVPFHFWLADAHAVAPTPVCVLLSGVMVELGLYGLARVYWTAFDGALHPQLELVRAAFLGFGVATALVGAVMCVLQRHLKRLLAYSTVSHAGLFLCGIGLFDAHALGATALYVAGHGLLKGALFFVAGVFLNRFGSLEERRLRGRGRESRVAGILLVVGSLGLAELPFTVASLGSEGLVRSGQSLGRGWIVGVVAVVSVLVGAALLRAAGRIVFGLGPESDQAPDQGDQGEREKPETGNGRLPRTPLLMLAMPALCLVAAIALRFWPELDGPFSSAAQRFVDRTAYANAVMRGAPPTLPSPELLPSSPTEHLFGIATTLVALALAALALRHKRARMLWGFGWLTRLHSGQVGDGVAWLTAGVALLSALLLRLA